MTQEEFQERTQIEEGQYAKKQNTFLRKFFAELPDGVEKKQYNLLKENYQKEVLSDIKKFLK